MPGDIRGKYLTQITPDVTNLQALAASSTRLAGWQSAAINITAISGGPPSDLIMSGRFTSASANSQTGQIDVWVVPILNDAPTWPDVFTASQGARTVTSANLLAALARPAITIVGDNVASRAYPFSGVSIANLFGGALPAQIVLFVAHNIQTTTNTWASSGNDIWLKPVLSEYTG